MTIEEEYELGKSLLKAENASEDQMQKAIQHITIAAEGGLAKAQFKLGWCYKHGMGVTKSNINAVEWYEKAAAQDYPYAWSNLGVCYEKGQGVDKDTKKAVQLYLKAAEKGRPFAQYRLGLCYNLGIGVEKDKSKAINWFTVAAENGNIDAQYKLGYCYRRGVGVEKDKNKMIYWFTEAAKNGNVDAQYDLGLLYQKGSEVEQNYPKAAEWFTKAAEQGYGKAQLKIGRFYEIGCGVKKDSAKAVEWYEKAAAQGEESAINNLGVCYRKGEGVEKDVDKAFQLYMEAAQKGNKTARYNLGLCFKNGRGTVKDYKKAVEWFTKAAKSGDEDAQFELGRCYKNGYGIPKDIAAAVQWYTKAAKKGNSSAQNNLANLYRNGIGVEKDYKKAIELFSQAIELGNKTAAYNLSDCYEDGDGVEKDYEKAFYYAKIAADKGHISSKKRIQRYFNTSTGVIENLEEGFKLSNRSEVRNMFANYLSKNFKNGSCVKANSILSSFWKEKYAAITELESANVDDLKKEYENGNVQAAYYLAVAKSKDEEDALSAIELFAKAADAGIGRARYILSLYNSLVNPQNKLTEEEKEAALTKAIDTPYELDDLVNHLYGDTNSHRLLWAILCLYSNHIGSSNSIDGKSDDKLHAELKKFLKTAYPIFDDSTEKLLNKYTSFYDRKYFEKNYPTGLLKILNRSTNNIETPTSYPGDQILEQVSKVLTKYDRKYKFCHVLDMYSSMGRLAARLSPKMKYIGYVSCYEDSLISRIIFQAWKKPLATVRSDNPDFKANDNEAVVCITPLRQYSYAPFDVLDSQIKTVNEIVSKKKKGIAVILVDQDFCTAIETDMEGCRTDLFKQGLVEEIVELPRGSFGNVESRTALLILNFNEKSEKVRFSSIGSKGTSVSYNELADNRYILDSLLYRQAIISSKGETVFQMKDLVNFHIKGYAKKPDTFVGLSKENFSSSLLSLASPPKAQIIRNDNEGKFFTKFPGPAMHITYHDGIKLYYSTNPKEYTCHYNFGFAFKVNKDKILPEYLALQLWKDNVRKFISGIVDDESKFPESEFMYMKIAVNPNLKEQKRIVEDALMNERQATRSGLEYNLMLVSSKTGILQSEIGNSLKEKGISIFETCSDIESFEERIKFLLRDTQSTSSIDAIAIDTALENWEDTLQYLSELRGHSIPMYLISAHELQGLRNAEKEFFANRIFNVSDQDFKDSMAMKIRDDLDLGNSRYTKIRNQYIEVFNAAESLDDKYNLKLSKSIMQFIYDGSRIDDNPTSGVCGELRHAIHQLLKIFIEKGMVPNINPGSIPHLLSDRVFVDSEKTKKTYFQIDPIMPQYLSNALIYFCLITNSGVHDSQDSSNLGHAALRIAMEFILWFNKEFNPDSDKTYFKSDSEFQTPAKGELLTVKMVKRNGVKYWSAGNVHLETDFLNGGKIKAGDKVRIRMPDKLKFDKYPDLDSNPMVVFYAQSKNFDIIPKEME